MPQPHDEPYYCSQQIHVPPELPDILKQFTKAAIRTQPKDVLAWSSAYFHAMANGEVPPAKERLDKMVATQKDDTGLSPELLRVLNRQLGPKKIVPLTMIEEKWENLALPKEAFDDLVRIGDMIGEVKWIEFLALASSSLTPDISSSMKLLCEILTADAAGGPARIPLPLFRELYTYLAKKDTDINLESVNTALAYLETQANQQNGFVMPRNFLDPHCPNLAGHKE